MDSFGAKLLHMAQAARCQPFFHGGVGGLRIHIDQSVALADGDQIIFGLPAGIIRFLTPDFRSHREQLPAPAGVLHMDDFVLSVDLHMGNKPVGPGKEGAGGHVGVFHKIHLWKKL